MIHVLQIIVHMPLFTISFPANAQMCYNLIISITKFNIFGSSKKDAFNSEESESPNEYFDFLGYKSTMVIQNLGSIFNTLLGILSVIVALWIMKCIGKKFTW